jgi:hypothetical protein
MNKSTSDTAHLGRFGNLAGVVGLVALAICAAGALVNPEQFFHSYLVAYVFWIGIALGSLALFMLHNLVGGGWGFLIRRILEASSQTMPLLALLFVPILLGMHELYIWTHEDVVAGDEALLHKQPYLNVGFFAARAVFYFIVWTTFATILRRWSLQQDRSGDGYMTRKMELVSGPGMVAFGLTATFASVDWIMSLEPHWFSTIYGLIFMMGQGVSALAFATILVVKLSDKSPISDRMTPGHLRDLGTLMFAFVMLWAYVSFSQYLIIWSANLPEEIPWYIQRSGGGWLAIAVVVVIFHFAVPFSLLLSRYIKRRAKVMVSVSVMMLLMRYVDLFWYVVPGFSGHGEHAGPTPVHVHWMDPLTLIGIGGVWLWFFVKHLDGKPLMPLHDPRMEDAFAGGEGH